MSNEKARNIFLLTRNVVLALLAIGLIQHIALANSDYKSAPNDRIIQEIIRLHQSPDSVMQELQYILDNNPSELKRAETLYLISIGFNKLNKNTESLNALVEANALLKDLDEPLLTHRVFLSKAQILMRLGRAKEALPLAEKVTNWAREKDIKQLYIGGLLNSGTLNASLNYHDRALEYFKQAYEQANKHKTKISPSHIASLMANVYLSRGDSERAIPFYIEALDFARHKGNKIVQKTLLYNLGEAFQLSGDIEQALVYSLKSLDVAKALSDKEGVGASQIQMASILLKVGQVNEAIELYEKALQHIAVVNNPFQQFNANYGLANSHLKAGSYQKATKYLQNAQGFIHGEAMEEEHILAEELNAELLFHQGKGNEAYLMLKINIARKAALLTKQNEEKVLLLRTQFETIKKEKENNELRRLNGLQEMQISSQKMRYIIIFIVMLALICVVALMLLINVRSRRYQRHLENIVNFDTLTGLCSRKYILEIANHELALAKELRSTITLSIIDLDYFKKINDQFGHPKGDKILAHFGTCAQKSFGENVKLGRIGGEEFLFIFTDISIEDAFLQLDDFRQNVKVLAPSIAEHGLSFSISAGIVESTEDVSISNLLSVADQALYEAKSNGRDIIVRK